MPPARSLENSTETESTLSAPNQVAKTVAVFHSQRGRLRPATT